MAAQVKPITNDYQVEQNQSEGSESSYEMQSSFAKVRTVDEMIKEFVRLYSIQQVNEYVKLRQNPDYAHLKLLLPDDHFKTFWDILITIFLLYTAVVVPYQIVFVNQTQAWTIFDTLNDGIFFLDLLIQFNTAYYDIEDNLIIQRKKIAVNYLSTWFFIDLISCLPFQIIFGSQKSWNKLIRILRIPRLYRLIKIAKLLRIFKITKGSNKFYLFFSKIFRWSRQVERFFQLILTLLVVAHIISCLWCMVGMIRDKDQVSWLSVANYQNSTKVEIYIAAFYWTLVTLITVGYGDIHPTNSLERVFTCVVMILGVLFYSYTISTLTNLLNTLDKRNSIINKKMIILDEISKDYHISNSLKKKIIHAVKYEQSKNQQEKVDFVNQLPPNLKVQLSVKMNEALIKKNTFFINKPPQFIACISPLLKPVKLEKGEIIYQEGDHPEEMYFVISGLLACITKVNGLTVEYAQIKEGEHFGETELIYEKLEQRTRPRDQTIQALRCTELLALDKQNFDDVFFQFESYFGENYIEADLRHNELNKMKDQAILTQAKAWFEQRQQKIFKRVQEDLSPDKQTDKKEPLSPMTASTKQFVDGFRSGFSKILQKKGTEELESRDLDTLILEKFKRPRQENKKSILSILTRKKTQEKSQGIKKLNMEIQELQQQLDEAAQILLDENKEEQKPQNKIMRGISIIREDEEDELSLSRASLTKGGSSPKHAKISSTQNKSPINEQ